MYTRLIFLLLSSVYTAVGQPGKCDQTPPGAINLEPTVSKYMPFELGIHTKGIKGKYLPDQTYILILESKDPKRPFREFMITAEDPEVDNNVNNFEHRNVDVGSLKTLGVDAKSRYSERCFSSVENTDHSDKYRIEVHWVSPKQSENHQRIRFRAMVAENKEVWYQGESLTIVLEKDNAIPIDSPPVKPNENCNLCSEARYEVIFKGLWSRWSHPRYYPSKPDENFYSHMIGASHDIQYILWQQGTKASPGLRKVAVEADISVIEREIIGNMSEDGGTRTLIRGKKQHHPHMFDHSHALFRVDRTHHLFSLVVAMKPSPDWFLGTTRFELCTDEGWYDHHEISLFPWDAGVMDGISYESPKSVTQPEDNVERVAVGSFNKESPFFQMNLNDLKPFAKLEVRRLDVYPLVGLDCSNENKDQSETKNDDREGAANEEPQEEPLLAESRRGVKRCLSEWSEWSPCIPFNGFCGDGIQTRDRYETRNFHFESEKSIIQTGDRYDTRNFHFKSEKEPDGLQVRALPKCHGIEEGSLIENRDCHVKC